MNDELKSAVTESAPAASFAVPDTSTAEQAITLVLPSMDREAQLAYEAILRENGKALYRMAAEVALRQESNMISDRYVLRANDILKFTPRSTGLADVMLGSGLAIFPAAATALLGSPSGWQIPVLIAAFGVGTLLAGAGGVMKLIRR